jgi:hypothetical protein
MVSQTSLKALNFFGHSKVCHVPSLLKANIKDHWLHDKCMLKDMTHMSLHVHCLVIFFIFFLHESKVGCWYIYATIIEFISKPC